MGNYMAPKSKSGMVLIGVGALFLLAVVFRFNVWKILWPLFILIPGFAFEIGYFSKPAPFRAGLLVPGGILSTLGLVFMIGEILPFTWEMLWPFFIFAPAVGLFQLYLFGHQDRGLLIPVGILTTLTAIFLLTTKIGLIFIGVILIFWGLNKAFGSHTGYYGKENQDNNQNNENNNERR